MIPTTCFSALTFIKIDMDLFIGSQDCIYLRWMDYQTAEFLSEIKERHDLRPSVLLKQVVG